MRPISGRARRLIVNADDFGKSHAINRAVISAHREGILTSASLMAGGAAFDEAVELARAHPRLGVGLHLTLVCGSAILSPSAIPGLVDARGAFSSDPAAAGCRYFFRRALRSQLKAEIEAQFARFHATGLVLDHVNGHLHLHLHPSILPMVLDAAVAFGARGVRLTRDPLRLNAWLARGRWGSRLSHGLVFHLLSTWARPAIRRSGLRSVDRVFGLLQNGCVDERYVLGLLARLPEGDSELYSHPDIDAFRHEHEALMAPAVREAVTREGIALIRYQDV